MLRGAVSKVVWVGRATVFLVGLSVILAVVLGVATAAVSATNETFILGRSNQAETPTSLISTLTEAAKSALIVNNKSGGVALDLRVTDPDTTNPALKDVAPMKVNSQAEVANLNAQFAGTSDNAAQATNADTLDGQDANDIVGDAKPLAASVNADGSLARSNRTGISSVNLSNSTGIYKVTFPST
jgi:hypothetical protein